jgi:hypothetical protein
MIPDQHIELFAHSTCGYLDVWAVFDFSLDHGKSVDSDSSILMQSSTETVVWRIFGGKGEAASNWDSLGHC